MDDGTMQTKEGKTVAGVNLAFAQQKGGPLGNSDESFQKERKLAAEAIAKQQAFESSKTADVEANNNADKAAAQTLKDHVVYQSPTVHPYGHFGAYQWTNLGLVNWDHI